MDLHSQINEIDWDMLFLVSGLYILNWSVEELYFFDKALSIFVPFKDSFILPVMTLWISLILSGFLGALPVTLIFINIVRKIPVFPNKYLLYLSLAIGVGIGGNLTPVS